MLGVCSGGMRHWWFWSDRCRNRNRRPRLLPERHLQSGVVVCHASVFATRRWRRKLRGLEHSESRGHVVHNAKQQLQSRLFSELRNRRELRQPLLPRNHIDRSHLQRNLHVRRHTPVQRSVHQHFEQQQSLRPVRKGLRHQHFVLQQRRVRTERYLKRLAFPSQDFHRVVRVHRERHFATCSANSSLLHGREESSCSGEEAYRSSHANSGSGPIAACAQWLCGADGGKQTQTNFRRSKLRRGLCTPSAMRYRRKQPRGLCR